MNIYELFGISWQSFDGDLLAEFVERQKEAARRKKIGDRSYHEMA